MTPEIQRRQLRLSSGETGTLSMIPGLPLPTIPHTPPPPFSPLCAHRKAHLPGRGHGPHGTIPLLHLHPSKLLPTLSGTTCWHRHHAQGLRLWQHPSDLRALLHGPLSAPCWTWKEPSENRALPVFRRTQPLHPPSILTTILREGTITLSRDTGQQGSSPNMELYIFYIQQKSNALAKTLAKACGF